MTRLVITLLCFTLTTPCHAAAVTVDAVTATVTLGGGKAVVGAQGIALDPTTGLFYVALNGNIVGGCSGDASQPGAASHGAGAGQLSIVDAAQGKETVAVPSGSGPVWPTVDPERRVVYVANSGAGTVTAHDSTSGTLLSSISVGGMPHMGGLDYATRLMVVGNTVKGGGITEQIHSSVIDTSTGKVTREFVTAQAPHGMVVDQERHLIYFSAVGDGTIHVVDGKTGLDVMSGIPISKYGKTFGNNNMISRQAATRRLFQVNSQAGATGAVVINETNLTAETVISFGNNAKPWGLWVDEPHRLLFAALPNSNTVAVADLDTLTHVANIPVGQCPYAVAVDPERRIGLVTNMGSPTLNATASVIDLCPVYLATGRYNGRCRTKPSFGAAALLGLADGNTLALAWKNSGDLSSLALNVNGAYTGTLPLSNTAEMIQLTGVPAGTYSANLVAKNSSGATVSSASVALTFPGTCTAPQTPTGLVATVSGRNITARWEPAVSGSAPTHYRIGLSGAYVGNVTAGLHSLSGTVSPGSYTLDVAAVNGCGSSTATATQTVVVQ